MDCLGFREEKALNIANINGKKYEFLERKDEIILISSTWVPGFEIETLDGMYLYTKHNLQSIKIVCRQAEDS